MEKYITNNEEETFNLGRKLAKNLLPGAVLAISGELGSGKTALVRGIVSFFGEFEQVSSPTYTLVNEYSGKIPLYHFDVYRLNGVSITELDWLDEYLFADGICLIEWAEYINEILPEGTVYIRIKAISKNSREITVE